MKDNSIDIRPEATKSIDSKVSLLIFKESMKEFDFSKEKIQSMYKSELDHEYMNLRWKTILD